MNKNMMKMAAVLVALAAFVASLSSCKKDDPKSGDEKAYIANGQNYGQGVVVGSLIWAPVNCGYDKDHPYGKLYQWGRKDGHGYQGEAGVPEIKDESLSSADAANPNWFYINWVISDETLWAPSGAGNPCPSGWRVPTKAELETLLALADHGSWVTEKGIECFKIPVGDLSIFIPSAGYLKNDGSAINRGEKSASLWSSTVEKVGERKIAADLYFHDGRVEVDADAPELGLSVRCVKEVK